jgi:hypothetical protein
MYHTKTINTRLPLSNTDTSLGICYVFPVIHIIIKLLSNFFFKDFEDSQKSVRKKVLEEHSLFRNCHIIGLDNGSLVLIVYGTIYVYIIYQAEQRVRAHAYHRHLRFCQLSSCRSSSSSSQNT